MKTAVIPTFLMHGKSAFALYATVDKRINNGSYIYSNSVNLTPYARAVTKMIDTVFCRVSSGKEVCEMEVMRWRFA